MWLVEFKIWEVRGRKAVQVSRKQCSDKIDLYSFDGKFGGELRKIERIW